MLISSTEVSNTIKACLFTDAEMEKLGKDELMKKAVIVKGVVCQFGFNPEKLKAKESTIHELLKQLPDAFQEKKGGGMSFLNACMDQKGEQWGEHHSIDELLCLGLAIKKEEFCLPREMWSALPGGMPYFVVKE